LRHLTDDEIQAYLDGEFTPADAGLEAHLRTCAACQNALREYETLYSRLADRAAFESPRDLAATVVLRLGLRPRKRRFSLPADIILLTGAIVCMVGVALVFLDLRPFVASLAELLSPVLHYATVPLGSALTSVAGANHTLTVALAGLAILVFTALLDLAFRPGWPALVRHRRP
jgi:anti-sigma factor RsiW